MTTMKVNNVVHVTKFSQRHIIKMDLIQKTELKYSEVFMNKLTENTSY